MKRKEVKKLHQLGVAELQEKLVQARKELVDLRMSAGREKTKDTRAVAKKRDEIAKIATILKEKDFLAEVERRKEEKSEKT